MKVCVRKNRLFWDRGGGPTELQFISTKSVAGFVSTIYEVRRVRAQVARACLQAHTESLTQLREGSQLRMTLRHH